MNQFDLARLELNAQLHRGHDPHLDKIADSMDSGDVEGWRKLPPRVIDAASFYRDARQQYRAAVAAGAIPDDRSGPSAA